MGGMLFDFQALGKMLRQARAGTGLRQNPPRTPAEYLDLLEGISQWARVGQKKNTKLVDGNAKMNKDVSYSPTGTSTKLGKTQKKVPWITQGVALMPAKQLNRFFRINQDPRKPFDKEKLKKFSLTEADINRFSEACPGRTAGCMSVCLADSGMMGQDTSTVAQVKRHLVYHMDRHAFMVTLAVGIAKLYGRALKQKANLGIRLNVTSDISWESQPITVDPWLAEYLSVYGLRDNHGGHIRPGKYRNIMQLMPGVFFYDYTKVFSRMDKFLRGRMPKNYHLVWSLAETPMNRMMAIRVLRSRKSTVSVPFYVGAKKKPLPKTLTIVDNTRSPVQKVTRTVFDADAHDMRALDEPGTFAGLKFKIPIKQMKGHKGIKKLTTPEKIKKSKGFVIVTQGDPHPVIAVRR